MSRVILFVEDNERDQHDYTFFFEQGGWEVLSFENAEDVLAELDDILERIDIAILDQRLPDMQGQELGEILKTRSAGRIVTALFTRHGDEELARETLREKGFDDYLRKQTPTEDLLKQCEVLQKFAEERRKHAEARRELEEARQRMSEGAVRGPTGRITMDEDLKGRIADVHSVIAPSLKPVLILGGTGTGKEMIAEEIHRFSGLYDEGKDNFRALLCGGISDKLLLSELFGHVKGAFTDAKTHKLGVILEAAGLKVDPGKADSKEVDYLKWIKTCCSPYEEPKKTQKDSRVLRFEKLATEATANFSGTLFLDEVADLSGAAQNALMRFLDGSGFMPVGYNGIPLAPRVRVVAATNRINELLRSRGPSRDRNSEVIIPGFRTDLLWRLMRWVVWLPALHERDVEDPLAIAVEYAKDFGEGRNGDLVPGNLRNLSFEFADGALSRLRKMIGPDERRFSGDEPLRSGNMRNLLGLVDRACWLAMRDKGIYPRQVSSPVARQKIEISLKILNEAAKIVQELEERLVEQPDDRDSVPGRLDGGHESVTKGDSDDSNAVSVESVKKLYRCLAKVEAWHPRDFPENEQLDEELVLALAEMFATRGHKDLEQDFEIWIDSPGQALKEVAALVQDRTLRRWRYLFMLSIVAAASRLKNTEKAPDDKRQVPAAKDVEGLFRGEREIFRSLLPKAFEPFKVQVILSEGENRRQSRPVGDLILFLTDPDELAKKLVTKSDKNPSKTTRFEYDGEDERVAKFVNHIRGLARQLQLK